MKITEYFPSLKSEITGEFEKTSGLAFFRGIPFATVTKRWTHSEPRHTLDSPFDATQFGPRCDQQEGHVLVTGGTHDPLPGDDEFDCLNLNVCVPEECLKQFRNGATKSKVPVMVWIHGGGWVHGANSIARYRPHKLGAIARQSGRPVIIVQIGYRLGAMGFAASEDLASERSESVNGSKGENSDATESAVGNYGFVDQRNALKWVQEHIADFGGDPDNVTAFGISAGSASIHYHILTGDPMFDRAICMSGSAPTLGPLPYERYQSAWDDLCKSAGVEDESREVRLEKLRALKPLELLKKYPSSPNGPVADGRLLPKDWTFDQKIKTRCRELILGDTNCEAIILDAFAEALKPSQFQATLRSVFPEADADEFNRQFGFSGDGQQPWEKYRDAFRRFFSVVMFQFPNLRIAETFKMATGGEAYLYHFEEPSPYPGPTYGLSYHGLCALFMHCVENEEALPKESQHVAETMAQMWTSYAHGIAPWEPYADSALFMRFGPHGKVGVTDRKSDETRDRGYEEWLRANFESVKEFARTLLNGRRVNFLQAGGGSK